MFMSSYLKCSCLTLNRSVAIASFYIRPHLRQGPNINLQAFSYLCRNLKKLHFLMGVHFCTVTCLDLHFFSKKICTSIIAICIHILKYKHIHTCRFESLVDERFNSDIHNYIQLYIYTFTVWTLQIYRFHYT